MHLSSTLLTPLKKASTSQSTAWKDGIYLTYRLNFAITGVRLHALGRSHFGRWFAVDPQNWTALNYQHRLALVNKQGKPILLKKYELDYFILYPTSIFNVGIAAKQGFHTGGAWQFEFVKGPQPILDEVVKNPKRISI
jgi:hypothetical protein